MNTHPTRTRALLAGAALLLAAVPTAGAGLAEADSSAPERGAPYVETRLFFGTARPDGGPAVTDRYPVGEAAASDRKIEEIRRSYEKEFGPEAVAWVDERARVDF
ncbi:hypothetical protein ACFYZ2_27140 [Streptomyces sviceus]|uniref:hypothetical protein n=1 Tax=Streptomyces sviceus TaxID=285530 RepID=UPI0036AD286A